MSGVAAALNGSLTGSAPAAAAAKSIWRRTVGHAGSLVSPPRSAL
jgi:hypothetical protein